jgi:hypothetical protein
VVESSPDQLEAAAVAGAFAADYLSWDEDDPGRRGQVLAEYLAAPVCDPGLLGWDGRGRQRAEFALPGPVRAGGNGRVLVDVRVRVTPYRAVGRAAEVTGADDAAEAEPDVPGVAAAAPAPTARGWRGCASYWIRVVVPVVLDGDRLVVDAEADAPAARSAEGPAHGVREEPARAADDPLAEPEPVPEGAW